MVVYDSKQWLRALANFYRSYTIKRIFTYVLYMGALTAGLCVLILEVLEWELRVASGVFSLLGIVLSILLVFRTNTAYDRWWEGRRQWGELVNNSRNLAMLLDATLPPGDVANRVFFAKYIANFALALMEHLRDGVHPAELQHLEPEEVLELQSKTHIPNHLIHQLYRRVEQVYRAGEITGKDLLNIKPHLEALTNVLGACERIKKTPIPFSYNIYIKTFILAYSLLLPFALMADFGYYTILFVMFIFYAFMGVELMAQEIEEPFGLDCNDLPLHDIANTIKNNTYEILCLYGEVKEEREGKLFEKVF